METFHVILIVAFVVVLVIVASRMTPPVVSGNRV
jgi:hypothetical protein